MSAYDYTKPFAEVEAGEGSPTFTARPTELQVERRNDLAYGLRPSISARGVWIENEARHIWHERAGNIGLGPSEADWDEAERRVLAAEAVAA